MKTVERLKKKHRQDIWVETGDNAHVWWFDIDASRWLSVRTSYLCEASVMETKFKPIKAYGPYRRVVKGPR